MSGRSVDVDEESSLLDSGKEKVRHWWDGFAEFAFSGNILEIAFGLMLATAFTSVVQSFVNHVLMPILSVIFPVDHTLEEKFALLRPGPNYSKPSGYNTHKQAVDDGAIVLAYGAFLDHIINFCTLGLSLYFLAHVYQFFSRDTIIRKTKKCGYCRKSVSEKALRCLNCTSWLDGREDQKSSSSLIDH